jgi:hypothetical protein
MKRISHVIDPNGNPVLNGLSASDHVDARVLAATTAEVHTIPTGAKSVRFTGTGPFFIHFGAAAAIPAADVTDGTASTLILTDRIFAVPDGVTTIGIIASAICTVIMEFYS